MLDYPGSYCSAIPGEKILAYLRYGGVVKIDLGAFPEAGSLRVTWLDPSSGEKHSSTIRAGGEERYINSPTSYPGTLQYRDWVMLIEAVN
jgi:hypothetical protein